MEFRDSIKFKVKTLGELQPWSDLDGQVVDSQCCSYRNILWEIDSFIEWLADDERDKFSYINEE